MEAMGWVSTTARTDLEIHAFLCLQMSENTKQVLGRRIAPRPKHPHETLAGIDVAASNCRKPTVALI
jgi:hypothetical protein